MFPEPLEQEQLTTTKHGKDLNSKQQGNMTALCLAGWTFSKFAKVVGSMRTAIRSYCDLRKKMRTGKRAAVGKNGPHMLIKITNATFKGLVATKDLKYWLY